VKKAITVVASVLIVGGFSGAGADPFRDLAGRVHYTKIPIDDTIYAPAVLDGAVVELYRMTPSGWSLFAYTTTGANDYPEGFYIFEGVDCGGDTDTLFEYADYCKVLVDAGSHSPYDPIEIPNWPDGKSYVAERYVVNSPQPAGIYAGKLRCEVIYFEEWITPVEEPEERDFDFEGHYVCLDGEGYPYTPDPNATEPGYPPAHQAHCPPSADPLTIWGCRGGHFYRATSRTFWRGINVWRNVDARGGGGYGFEGVTALGGVVIAFE
jgi:hypothetical protein